MPVARNSPGCFDLPLKGGCLALLLSIGIFFPAALQAGEACNKTIEPGLAVLARDQLDSALEAIAASNRAIASEWLKARAESKTASKPEATGLAANFQQFEAVTLFRSWPGNFKTIPSYRSEHTAWYAYNRVDLLEAKESNQLAVFERLEPALRVVNQTFNLTWTYITTKDNWMMLYPFLTPDEAKNNQVPSKQVFYTAADFDRRSTGWTPPYLDLAGAGMMVTAAFPVYEENELLGVVSQDITLQQLSGEVLQSLAGKHCIAWLVDSSGLAIAASEAELETEIEQVNSTPEAGGLYYLAERAVKALGNDRAVASKDTRINQLTSKVLDETAETRATYFKTSWNDSDVVATRSSQTGWWLILASR